MQSLKYPYLFTLLLATSLYGQKEYPVIGTVERLSEKINTLISTEAKIEVLATGFGWSEGPVWVPNLHGVVFSDVRKNKAYLWTKSGGLDVFLDPSGHTGYAPSNRVTGSNGLALDAQGNLIICQHGDRRIAQLVSWEFETPQYKTIVDQFQNKRFNSPNDLVLDSKGQIYFTDPPYGFKNQDNDSLKELEENGVYLWSKDDGATLLDNSLHRPNGIALSLDEKTLFVANSHPDNPVIIAFDIQNGSLSNRRVFFDGTDLSKNSKNIGNFDGLKVHSSGNIFATGPGGVLVLDATGNHLGTIRLDGRPAANCGFGPDENYLYITAQDILVRIDLL